MDTKTAKDILTEAGLNENPWGIRVIAAEEAESFTEDDKDDANNWRLCPCGLLKGIPRGDDSCEAAPTDKILYDIGMEFGEFVNTHNFAQAAWAICEIDTRSKEVITAVIRQTAPVYPLLGLAIS